MISFTPEELEMQYGDANRRFQIIKGGLLPQPGSCITCGSVDRDCIWFGATNYIHFPNTDGSQDRYGSVLICLICFASAVTENPFLGFYTTEQHETAIKEVEQNNERFKRVDGAAVSLGRELTVAIDNYRNRIMSDLPDIVSIPVVPIELPKAKPTKPAGTKSAFEGLDWAGTDLKE